jgi:hypothetical protein
MNKNKNFKLYNELKALSKCDNSFYGLDEWTSLGLEYEDELCLGQCVCGKKGIRYQFRVFNNITGKTLYPIGSECVKRIDNEQLLEMFKDIERELKLKEKAKKKIEKMDNEILTNGKYEGKTFKYVVDNHTDYCNFIYNNVYSNKYKKFKEYLKLLNFII